MKLLRSQSKEIFGSADQVVERLVYILSNNRIGKGGKMNAKDLSLEAFEVNSGQVVPRPDEGPGPRNREDAVVVGLQVKVSDNRDVPRGV